jgi:hypothetical protein
MSLLQLLKENIGSVYDDYAKNALSNAKFKTWFANSVVTIGGTNTPKIVFHPTVERFKTLSDSKVGYLFSSKDGANARYSTEVDDKKGVHRTVFFNFENALLPYPYEFEKGRFERFFSQLGLNKDDEELVKEDFRQMMEDVRYNYTQAQQHRFFNEEDYNKNKTLKDLLDKHASDKTLKKLKIKKTVFKSNTMPFYLKIENPFLMIKKDNYDDVSGFTNNLYNDINYSLKKGITFNGMDNITDIENYCVATHEFHRPTKVFNFSSIEQVRNLFEDFNFDGVIVDNADYIVFDVKNVKSVLNDESFDADDSNFMS